MSTLKKNGISNASIIDALTAALSSKGIPAVAVETVKNGIIMTGFQIDNGTNVKPVVYYSSEETVEAFVEKVIRIKEQPAPKIDTENLISKERLLKDTVLCLQKRSSEDLVKRDFLNLELYVRLFVPMGSEETTGSIKVKEEILRSAGMSKDELFEAAKANSSKIATVTSMAEALGAPPELFEEAPFYVGTYRKANGSLIGHGAAVLALPEILHQFCAEKGLDMVYLIPSSTEEVLLLPVEKVDSDEVVAMIAEINATIVDPVLWLEPVLYVFDNESMEVTIVASSERRC